MAACFVQVKQCPHKDTECIIMLKLYCRSASKPRNSNTTACLCLVIFLGYSGSTQNQEISHGSRTKDLVVSWFQMQEDRGERDRPNPGQHGNVHRVHPRGGLPVPHTGTLYSVQCTLYSRVGDFRQKIIPRKTE